MNLPAAMHRFCLVAIWLWLSGPLAQAADFSYSSDDYVVEVWNTDSGLPQSTVTSIAQTPDGYLWIGTLNGGLARFDGMQFVNFHPGNTPELKSFEVHQLAVDAAGTLWIGLVEGDVLSYRDGKFRFELRSADTPASWLRGVVWRQNDEVLLSSAFGWLFHGELDRETNRWATVAVPDSNNNSVPGVDRDGVIWYCTADGWLGQVRGTNVTVLANPPGLRGGRVNTLISDAQGRIWVGTDKELAVWDGKTFVDMTPTNGPPELAVSQMVACRDGSLWVIAGNALGHCADRCWLERVDSFVDQFQNAVQGPVLHADSRGGAWASVYGDGLWHVSQAGRVSRIGPREGLPNASVECWFEDHEGNVWAGLRDGGLVCLRPRLFHTVWPAARLANQATRSVCEDAAGAMWFGTAGRAVLRWQDGIFTNFIPPSEWPFNELTVLPDGATGVWVGSVQNGVLQWTNGGFQRPFPSAEIGMVVRALHVDHAGALWIGSEFGLFRWAGGKLKRFTPADGFSAAYVLAIAEDAAGTMWFGTAVGELRRFQNGTFKTFRPEDDLGRTSTVEPDAISETDPMQARGRGNLSGRERFWALHPDADGGLWIGTLGGGLLHFQDGRFTRYTTRDGLPDENVSQILEDDRGRLWLGTHRGIARIKKSELRAFVPDSQQMLPFITYGKSDGLPAMECPGGSQPACWRSRDGRLWFSTIKGAVWVNPAEQRFNPLPPSVLMEGVLVDGRQMLPAKIKNPAGAQPALPEIRVAAGRHYFEFQFTALSFTAPDKVRFKWRLKGLEKNWVEGGDRRQVSYSFIPPGDYQFEVQACNNDGVWSTATAAVNLTVLPYFWQTWWFKLTAGLALVAGLIMLYSVRIARLRALVELRLRIARDLHDEVGANLGSISLLAQLMEHAPSPADAGQVRGIAVQTIDTLRDIVWFIDPTHDRLSDLVARLQETARVMLPTVAFTFEQSGDFRSADLSLAFRRNVPPLFKETLHNLLKHARATTVTISVRRRENEFQFRIQDNGVGFDAAKKSAGNGLKNLRRRAAEIGGRLEIETHPGGGTIVTLTAPITQTRGWWFAKNRVASGQN